MSKRLVYSYADLREGFGLSRNALDGLVERGELKAPILLSPRRKAFMVEDVEAFLSARAAMRDASNRPARPCA